MSKENYNLSLLEGFTKRLFDFIVAFTGLVILWPIILVCSVLACIDTKANGFFIQERVGRKGKVFRVFKIRTMKVTNDGTTITTKSDARITQLGAFFRKAKLDELPQLINVVLGQMSFVGPRPDVPGYADKLSGVERSILNIRPGITGPATLKYRNEEELLAAQEDPVLYNDSVIFPDKVKINLEYVQHWSFTKDLRYIIQTIIS